jgi:sugar phosphate isomerase/epimerase
MKSTALIIVAAIAWMGNLMAERSLSVFDNGMTDIKSVREQAVMLKELGYDGICTRPDYAGDELFEAMDSQGLEISATYLVIPANPGESEIAPNIVAHLNKLKGRKTIVWLAINNQKADDEATVQTIRKLCDLASGNGLEVVLYPHTGFRTSTAVECERLVKLADRTNLGVSFNLCHFLSQNDAARLESTLKAIAPHLKMVQISGADDLPPGKPDWKRLIQPLGSGSFDVGRVFRTLDKIGYKGPVNLQCYQIKLPAREHLTLSMNAWRKYHANDPMPHGS